LNSESSISSAIKAFVLEVKEGSFPNKNESY